MVLVVRFWQDMFSGVLGRLAREQDVAQRRVCCYVLWTSDCPYVMAVASGRRVAVVLVWAKPVVSNMNDAHACR